MSKKNTKRALLSSVLALVLCLAMLTGTTFAWFTDSVTSGKNQIIAGNLDVELVHTNATVTDEDVQGNSDLFLDKEGKPIKWEPGVMAWEKFTVQNVGNLALKYELSINFTNEVKVGGKGLSDVLKVAVLDEQPTRENIASAQLMDMADFLLADGTVLDAGKAESFYVAIYWKPTDHDNDYNMNNGRTEVLSIDLGVALFATQASKESDSFDNKYDDPAWVLAHADAVVEDVNELNTALAQGGLVALAADIDGNLTLNNIAEGTILNFAGKTVTGTVTVAEGQAITLNGDGGVAATGSNPAVKVGKDAEVTLDGGTYTSESGSAIAIANTKTEVPMKLTINDGATVTAPTLISLDAMNGYAGAEVEINGGTFTATKSGSYVYPINLGGGNITINGGTFEAPNATSYCCFIEVAEKYNTETKTYDVGNVTINGGTFKSNANYGRVVSGSIDNFSNRVPGTVTINGGTFEMTGTYGVLTQVGAHVVVNDCTFISGGASAFSTSYNNDTDRAIEVKGGTFTITRTLSADLIADGYHVVDNGNGTQSVVAD